MAAVAQSAVTIIRSETVGSASNKIFEGLIRASVALTTQGATTGDILAALFGLASIHSVICYRFVTAGLAEANIGVTTDGTQVYTFTSIDGSTAPANVTGTAYLELRGRAL